VNTSSLQYDLTGRHVFPDELRICDKYQLMYARLSLLILLLTVISGTSSLILERIDSSILLAENPLKLATELLRDEKMDEVLYLTKFAKQYLPADHEYSSSALAAEASASLDSPLFLIEHFAYGALTGEANDTAGLIGTLTLDLFVIGDIRDLLVQSYKEFDSGQGDEVIMGLSAAGLLLTLAPELSWAPSLFKTFWRGNRVSGPFQKQISEALSKARRTGDYSALKRMMSEFTEVVDHLGTGPAMSVFKQVKSTDDLALLAKKAKLAPMETYTLSSINGIKALEDISTTSAKQGNLVKRVKFATRQQKIMNKLFGLIPLSLLFAVCIFFIAIFMFVLLRFRSREPA
jgi:hypothetical protein